MFLVLQHVVMVNTARLALSSVVTVLMMSGVCDTIHCVSCFTACDGGTYGKACSVICGHCTDDVWCL